MITTVRITYCSNKIAFSMFGCVCVQCVRRPIDCSSERFFFFLNLQFKMAKIELGWASFIAELSL